MSTPATNKGPFENFKYREGSLTVDGLPLERIARKTGTPVYVYSADSMLKPLKALQKGLASVDVTVCFAVKSNSNIAVLKMLAQAGAGMDLVSGGELFRARKAGVPTKRIVLSGVGKTPEEMAMGLEAGIFSFNVESVAELTVLDHVARSMKKRATVALRFNPDVDAKTHPYISTGLKQNKFGINRAEVLKIVDRISRIGDFPGIDLRGISVHIGSQLLSLSPLGDAFRKLRDLVTEIDRRLDHPLSFVDLGGGVGIQYDAEKPPRVDDYCKLILKYFGPQAGLARPLKLLLEPGRLIAGNSGVLLTEVLYRKERTDKDFLVVDAAMNDLARPSLYGSFHGIVPVKKSVDAKLKKTDIVGPVCETGDCFARDRKLPTGLEAGDLVAILSAGAYGFTMSSNYNSRPRPPEVLVQNGKARVIRERETFDDLVRGEKA